MSFGGASSSAVSDTMSETESVLMEEPKKKKQQQQQNEYHSMELEVVPFVTSRLSDSTESQVLGV